MTWQLSDNWAVKCDPHNWVLQERSGKRWRSVGYYRTPEQLLIGLYERLLLTEPSEPTLIEHVEHSLTVAEACTARLSEHIHTSLDEGTFNCAQPHPTKSETELPPLKKPSLDLFQQVSK